MKDTITNIVAIALVLLGSVDAYFKVNQGQEINWINLGFCVLSAVVAYFTGKKADGTATK
jgi:hypothetical protein